MQSTSPLPLDIPLWQRLVLVAVIGMALRAVTSLEPIWWMAWIAPAPLLALACRSSTWSACASVALAALIGTSVNLHAFALMMPMQFAVLVIVMQALVWFLVIMGARRVVLRYGAWWTVLAYPLLRAATDTLMTHFLPDGNWGSMGYTQSQFLPALQLTSLFGVPGLVFMISLVVSALALPLTFGRSLPHAMRAHTMTALAMALTLAFGVLRLHTASSDAGQPSSFGLVAIDDFVGPKTRPALAAEVWRQYDEHIESLARQGAQVIVLPEKIAVVSTAQAAQLQLHLAQLAARLKVWIEVGIGVDDGKQRTNLAWLLSPQGTLAQNYQKHHMAPPEREFVAGHDYNVQDIGNIKVGLAVCKDMHFGTMGLAYGQRGADVMLVPAWDFKIDGPLATAITLTRGVENGYAIVRPSREGLLTVSDAYGHILASQASAYLPGSALLVKFNVQPRIATIYSRIGDLFGWLCMALGLSWWGVSLRKPSGRRLFAGAGAQLR